MSKRVEYIKVAYVRNAPQTPATHLNSTVSPNLQRTPEPEEEEAAETILTIKRVGIVISQEFSISYS